MNRSNSESGMTLIELLVVIVILGVLALIAIIGFQKIIQNTKDQAFVANAYSLKEAAEKYYLSSRSFLNAPHSEEIDYATIVTNGFLEPFKDPDTSEVMPADGFGTFVTIEKDSSGSIQYYICYKGKERQLCNNVGETSTGILFSELNTSLITENR